jgi:hypothetical protein
MNMYDIYVFILFQVLLECHSNSDIVYILTWDSHLLLVPTCVWRKQTYLWWNPSIVHYSSSDFMLLQYSKSTIQILQVVLHIDKIAFVQVEDVVCHMSVAFHRLVNKQTMYVEWIFLQAVHFQYFIKALSFTHWSKRIEWVRDERKMQSLKKFKLKRQKERSHVKVGVIQKRSWSMAETIWKHIKFSKLRIWVMIFNCLSHYLKNSSI